MGKDIDKQDIIEALSEMINEEIDDVYCEVNYGSDDSINIYKISHNEYDLSFDMHSYICRVIFKNDVIGIKTRSGTKIIEESILHEKSFDMVFEKLREMMEEQSEESNMCRS